MAPKEVRLMRSTRSILSPLALVGVIGIATAVAAAKTILYVDDANEVTHEGVGLAPGPSFGDEGGSGSGELVAEGFPNCNEFHEDPLACNTTPGCDYRVGSGCDFMDPPIPWGCYLRINCSVEPCPDGYECIEWDWAVCAFSQCQGCPSSLPPVCTPPCLTFCLADLNCDGMVGTNDLLELLAKWGPCAPEAYLCRVDIDGDGVTGVADFMILLTSWGPCAP